MRKVARKTKLFPQFQIFKKLSEVNNLPAENSAQFGHPVLCSVGQAMPANKLRYLREQQKIIES
jgi:hypothetical protein